MRLHSPELLWKWSRDLQRKGFTRLARIVKTLNWLVHKCLLPAEAQVGEGVILEHYAMGIVMHPQVRIGNRCRVYHHVTLAGETWIGSPHFITLEDDVTIGAHSIVVARPNTPLTIGRKSVLGAGSVLTKNIPPYEIWAGNPARKIGDVPQTL
ncbi:MAG: DapH/DapD/GlmU-related protein [Prosthecobacter sp.]